MSNVLEQVKETERPNLSPRAIKASKGLNKCGQTPEEAREARKLKKEVKEFAVNHGLDWGVIKKQFHININGEFIPTNDFALVHSRSNEVLNSVKGGYNVSQNLHIIQLMLLGVKPFGDELQVIQAGNLNGGRKVYIQLKVIGDAKIGNDTVERYVTIIDSNDGSTSLSVGIGNKTMSCNNQFFYFYKNGNAKFRHSASMQNKMKEIPYLIETALTRSLKMVKIYETFESTPCSRELAHSLVSQQLGCSRLSTKEELEELSTRKRNTMDSLYNNIYGEMDGDQGNGFVGKGENLWGLFSGVTRWTTHEKSAPRRDNGRLEGVMVGNNYKNNLSALKFALNEAKLVF